MTLMALFCPLFHFLCNTFIVFFFLAFAIETILFLFKIQNPRLRSFLRLLPLVKLPLDGILYFCLDDHILFNFNPFSCQYYLIDFLLPHQGYCSIPNFVAKNISPAAMGISLAFFFLITTIVFGSKVVQILKSFRHLNAILADVQVMKREVENKKLLHKLGSVKLLISDKTTTPFAAFGNRIVFPLSLVETLSQEEFEAIVAHELQHLFWKDPHIKLIGGLISHFFWWLPTRWWMKRCEWEQECASDSETAHFGVKGFDLAGGILQTIEHKQHEKFSLVPICHIVNELKVQNRLQRLLNVALFEEGCRFKRHFWIGIALCLGFTLTFWAL